MSDPLNPNPTNTEPKVPSEIDPREWGDVLVPVKIKGQEGKRPLKDVLARAQKDEAADLRLQELAEREEALADRLEMAKALEDGWKLKDPAKFTEGLVRLGIPREHAETWVKGGASPGASRNQPVDDDDEDDEVEGNDNLVQKLVSTIRQMPEMQKLQQMAAEYDGHKERLSKQSKVDEVKAALDKDPELSILYKKLAGKPSAQKSVLDSVLLAVNGRLADFPGWGPRPIQAGLADAKASLKELGILSDGQTNTGFGPSALPASAAYLDDEAASIVNDKDAEKHRSIFDPDFGKYVTHSIGRWMGRSAKDE